MSTYNGEKYLEEQIFSILDQKDVEVALLIRDDGSKDSTVQILKKIECTYKNVRVLCEKNLGVKKSFLRLVALADDDFDYYAFSDQDDIWIKDKLLSAVKELNKYKQDIPLLYGSSVRLKYSDRIGGKCFIDSPVNFGAFLVKNYFPGCTTVFNNKLHTLIKSVDYEKLIPQPLHDHWLNLVCLGCGGKLVFDPEPHIYYRQHENNVVGDRSLSEKIKSNPLFNKKNNIRYMIAMELLNIYGENLTPKSKSKLMTIKNYKSSLKNRLKLVWEKDIKSKSVIENIVLDITILSGRF